MTALVLDTETTGVNAHVDRVIELAVIDYDSEELIFHSYFNPGCKLSPDIIELTGISQERVDSESFFAPRSEEIADLIRNAEAVCAHNPWFDQRMLAAEFHRAGITDVVWPTLICTKRLWDIHEPREKRHLTNAYKRFVDPEGFEGAHGAIADTEAVLQVLKAQKRIFKLEELPWADFDPEQKTWWGSSNHVIWDGGILITNFGKYKGTPCHEVARSYWHWIRDQNFPEHVMVLADYMDVVVGDKGITAEELATWAYGKIG